MLYMSVCVVNENLQFIPLETERKLFNVNHRIAMNPAIVIILRICLFWLSLWTW